MYLEEIHRSYGCFFFMFFGEKEGQNGQIPSSPEGRRTSGSHLRIRTIGTSFLFYDVAIFIKAYDHSSIVRIFFIQFYSVGILIICFAIHSPVNNKGIRYYVCLKHQSTNVQRFTLAFEFLNKQKLKNYMQKPTDRLSLRRIFIHMKGQNVEQLHA